MTDHAYNTYTYNHLSHRWSSITVGFWGRSRSEGVHRNAQDDRCRSRAAKAATVMPRQLSWLSATHQPAQLFKEEGVELHVCVDPYVGRTELTFQTGNNRHVDRTVRVVLDDWSGPV